jgi:hypothetical protein
MRLNASGTTRANTSLTIGSLNDRKIFVTRSSAGAITCGTIRKRSKAYFVLFFNSHVELLMRVYIEALTREAPLAFQQIVSVHSVQFDAFVRARWFRIAVIRPESMPSAEITSYKPNFTD